MLRCRPGRVQAILDTCGGRLTWTSPPGRSHERMQWIHLPDPALSPTNRPQRQRPSRAAPRPPIPGRAAPRGPVGGGSERTSIPFQMNFLPAPPPSSLRNNSVLGSPSHACPSIIHSPTHVPGTALPPSGPSHRGGAVSKQTSPCPPVAGCPPWFWHPVQHGE